jgi:hypothetical protein
MLKKGLLFLLVLLAGLPSSLQPQDVPAINLIVRAGYDGLFRENEWFPIYVQISNDGADTVGRLVVRPERSGSAFTNTFSAPVEMPAGSRKIVLLYVTARSFASEVRVEFIGADEAPLAERSAPLRHVLYQDQLHLVLSQTIAGSVDLTGVRSGGYNAFQANWLLDNLPDRAAALTAVNTITFSDIDTGPLNPAQRQALADWVAAGGHLIVTGGANWQATAAGLSDLLPLLPETSDTRDNLDPLAQFVGQDALSGSAVIAAGTLRPEAQALAADDDGTPLLARRLWGLGVVDYLAADPLAQPLRDWPGLGTLWYSLITSAPPEPSWARGLFNTDRAAAAVEVLPGLNLLPDILPLCGFLAAYIALIGPLNYIVLNRLNRREWAWLTIPVFIVIFSALAWVVGFNLRGNTATLSRMAVVQSWPDSETARVDGLVGLLSPRRASYTLTMDDGSLVRPLSRSIQANPFAASVQASTDIQQSDLFRASDFTVDASFIAAFRTVNTIERPAISGQASLFYQPPQPDEAAGRWALRGSVRNDTGTRLDAPVILARGASLSLGAPLEPGALQTFEFTLDTGGQPPAAPSTLERSTGEFAAALTFSRMVRDAGAIEQTVREIIGSSLYSTRVYNAPPGQNAVDQENYRRQLLLSAIMQDHYQSTARGTKVYLAGWSNTMPLQTTLEGAAWEPLDTTLYLVELDVALTPPAGPARITADQFTWTARERTGLTSELAPVNAVFQPGDEAVFQFTPVPGAVLDQVDTLYVELTLRGTTRTDIPLELWDWQRGQWRPIELEQATDRSSLRFRVIRNPRSYIGANNSVLVRLRADEASGFLSLTRLAVEQEGRF